MGRKKTKIEVIKTIIAHEINNIINSCVNS